MQKLYDVSGGVFMNEDSRAILKEILGDFSALDYIRPEDVPDIPLYMDQITTFMDAQLKSCKRYPDDKILTKTMINNYTKNDLIPPPVKKKYSKEHLLLLIFVYYFKDFLSISDIEALLKPLTDKYFNSTDSLSLSAIYEDIYKLEQSQVDIMVKDIIRRYNMAQQAFPDAKKKDEEYLHTFAFICLLSFDVYVKKQLIEHLTDKLSEKDAPKSTKK